MNRMMPITIRPGATTAAVREIVFGKAWPIMPPPAATSTRKNVPYNSEKRRRHSWLGSLKSSMRWITSRSMTLRITSSGDVWLLTSAPLLTADGLGD